MEKKVYYNEELEEILNRHIKEEKYGGFKPLLNEIFQRRAYEYRFDHQHMEKEVINFVKNVKAIEFGRNIPEEDSLEAVYDSELKRIFFNSEYLKQTDINYLEMYETLTHEVYHSALEEGEGLADSLKEGGGVGINEIVTETAATRTTFSRTKRDNKKFRQETSGYLGMTFIVNLLAASFGIEERELLRGGLQNKGELDKALLKNIPNLIIFSDENISARDISRMNIETVEMNLDVLYNAVYDKDNENNKRIRDKNKSVINSCLVRNIHDIYSMASSRLLREMREIKKEYAEELAYDYKKIETILIDNINDFECWNCINSERKEILLNQIANKKSKFLKQVSDIIALAENKDKITDEQKWLQMQKLAREGKYIDTFGTESERRSENRQRLVEEYPKTNHEFDDAVQWDNEPVIEIMKQLWNEKEVVDVGKLKQEIDFQTMAQKIKNFVAKFKNRKQRKLNALGENGGGGFVELKSDFDERCKVLPEELEPMKHSVKPKGIESEKEKGKE